MSTNMRWPIIMKINEKTIQFTNGGGDYLKGNNEFLAKKAMREESFRKVCLQSTRRTEHTCVVDTIIMCLRDWDRRSFPIKTRM